MRADRSCFRRSGRFPPSKDLVIRVGFAGCQAYLSRRDGALIRELKEELGLDITESCLAPFTFASHRYEDFHLLMPLFLCRVWDGTPVALEGQELKWVRPGEMKNLAMPPADAPLVAMLRDFL